jgi:hypothetical protein
LERLKREGVKTHKERVEELNKYLSRLSEHHDMYVLFVSYSLVGRLGLTCAAIGRRLDPVKWGLETFLLYMYASYSVILTFASITSSWMVSSSHFSSCWT